MVVDNKISQNQVLVFSTVENGKYYIIIEITIYWFQILIRKSIDFLNGIKYIIKTDSNKTFN